MSKRTVRRSALPQSKWAELFRNPVWHGSVRFADLDAIGTVNYACYLQYVDDALFEWWSRLELPFVPTLTDWGLLTAAMSAAWTRPLKERHALEAAVGIADVGETSFAAYVALRVVGEDEPCFVARLVNVYFRGGVPTPIPDLLKSQLVGRRWGRRATTLIEQQIFRGRPRDEGTTRR